ncbi:MAG TPA: hypothetical protein VNZ49_04525 [Bacteroidia bacterium]|nr:hypothetical protein [Bacteroidia bacterium]
MRYLILFITAVFFLFCIREDDDIITWSKDRKLTWADYRGKPKKRFAAASTVYSLGRKVFVQDGKTLARICAYFYCKDSWKKDDWINQSVLDHEQKHFDIVELFCRRIRKQITTMTFSDFKDAEAKVDSLYQVYNKAMDVFQDKYDDETDGSMNGDAQRKWEKKIDNEIASLEKYQSILILLKLKTGN